jgi:hypothetical protein
MNITTVKYEGNRHLLKFDLAKSVPTGETVAVAIVSRILLEIRELMESCSRISDLDGGPTFNVRQLCLWHCPGVGQ